MRKIAALFIVVGLWMPAAAQIEASKPAAGATPSPTEALLLSALAGLERPEGVSFEGKATVQKPEPEEEDGAPRVMFRMGGPMGMGGGPGYTWTGAFELVRAGADGLVTTKAGLPGFTVYKAGTRSIVRTNTDGHPLDPGTIGADLAALLTPADLIAAVKTAKMSSQALDGGTVFRGELPVKLVRGRANQDEDDEESEMPRMMRFQAKVLKLASEFKVDAEGRLLGIKFSITRSDPMAAFQRRIREARENGEGGAISFGIGAEDEDDGPPEPGPTAVYELTPSGSASARAKSELESLRALVGGR